MKQFILALLAIFTFTTGAGAETLLFAVSNGVYAVEEDGTVTTVLETREQIISLTEGNGVVYAASLSTLWVVNLDSRAVDEWRGIGSPRAMYTPLGDERLLWVAPMFGGALVEWHVPEGAIIQFRQKTVPLWAGPHGCQGFTRHFSTQSMLCLIEEKGGRGFWVVPRNIARYDEWPNAQYFPLENSGALKGIASGPAGTYVLEEAASDNPSMTYVNVVELNLHRQGQGKFFLGEEDKEQEVRIVGKVWIDPDTTQPLAYGKRGLYVLSRMGEVSEVLLLEQDGSWTPIVQVEGRPTAIIVGKRETYPLFVPKG